MLGLATDTTRVTGAPFCGQRATPDTVSSLNSSILEREGNKQIGIVPTKNVLVLSPRGALGVEMDPGDGHR